MPHVNHLPKCLAYHPKKKFRHWGNYYYYRIFVMQINVGDLGFDPNSANNSL